MQVLMAAYLYQAGSIEGMRQSYLAVLWLPLLSLVREPQRRPDWLPAIQCANDITTSCSILSLQLFKTLA